jgi:hypothetical protein
MNLRNLAHLSLTLLILCGSFSPSSGQEKKKGFNLGERVGKLAGNLLTAKTADLKVVVAKPIYYCGVFPLSVNTTASKMMPATLVEGDHVVSISFFKNEGAGLYQIKGDVLCNGKPMDYVGVGSYMTFSSVAFTENPRIDITTETGDKATLFVKPIPEIRLFSVNGETSLPVVDVSEDLEIEIFNPAGAENTRIKVSILTDVMGVRAFNHFADFESGAAGVRKIKIPKAALANPEVAGQMNAGNFTKGENMVLVERMLITENDKIGAEQIKGNLHSVELQSVSCASMPVIIKGRQEKGLNFNLKITGYAPDTGFGFDFNKPNATTGIPLSLGSKFGLTSLTLDGTTFKQDSYTNSSSTTVGGTTYTRTTITTYTYEFPQLPTEYWDFVLDYFYKGVEKLMKEKHQIDFVPVEKVTSTSQYSTLFPPDEKNTKSKIQTSYKNTLRSNPRSLGEILGTVSSNTTSNTPVINMMKEADVDGLVSMNLVLTIGANRDNKIIMSPSLHVTMIGRDENNNNKQGTYVIGLLTGGGVPFNSEAVKNNKLALVEACNIPQLLSALDYALNATKRKEEEFGYNAIWTIGK